MTKLCKDCKHCKPAIEFLWGSSRYDYAECSKSAKIIPEFINLSSGKKYKAFTSYIYCVLFRQLPECGPEAKLFEAK